MNIETNPLDRQCLMAMRLSAETHRRAAEDFINLGRFGAANIHGQQASTLDALVAEAGREADARKVEA
jgi:hypothetical protein